MAKIGKLLLLLGVALATGCATGPSSRVIPRPLVIRPADATRAVLVPAAFAERSLPWGPAALPEGSIRVDGPFGDALNVATRLHRRLLAMGLPNRVTCRPADDTGSASLIQVEVPSAGGGRHSARLAQLTTSPSNH